MQKQQIVPIANLTVGASSASLMQLMSSIFTFRLGVLGLLVALACSVKVAQAVDDPPNILLVLTDDQGYGDIGLHGNPHLQTPAIDSFARDGVEFTQFLGTPHHSAEGECLD